MKVLAHVLPRQIGLGSLMATLVVACCLFSFAMPRAHAAALTESQKEAIVNLLASFNADAEVVSNVRGALDGVKTRVSGSDTYMPEKRDDKPMLGEKRALPAVCAVLTRALKKGSSGDDVTALQAFLQQTGDLRATSTTNYFGAVTERALQMWQTRMGIVGQGDADSTGFGAFGPKTRDMLVGQCRTIFGGATTTPGYPLPPTARASEPIDPTVSPTCTLVSNKQTIKAGEVVVLTWNSKNATYAGSPSGQKDSVYGSRKVMPGETTTYVKKVYGPAGEGQCTVTVTVEGTVPAAEQKVVVAPSPVGVGRVLSLMGSGVAAVFEGYVSLFDFQ